MLGKLGHDFLDQRVSIGPFIAVSDVSSVAEIVVAVMVQIHENFLQESRCEFA